MTNRSYTEAELIVMMGQPKTEKLAKRVNNLVADAGAAGALTDTVRKAFKAWRSEPVVAEPAPVPTQEDIASMVFIVDVMMRKKTGWRKKEVMRRVGKLRERGHMTPELSEAYSIWCRVPVDGMVSSKAPPAPATSDEAAPAVVDVAFAAATTAPEGDQKKHSKRRRNKKPAGNKTGDEQPAPVAKPAPEPLVVLKGTSHPDGEPVHSPFAGALAALAALAASDGAQAESVAA